ncbi:hypothetical protein FIBSPDRAFT_876911 [Athelia psychrophila]|uniref:Uncharacterized protein n=1 Tax=Athelia psychrophila TaxID=1759441 RepID=A0A167WE96_9AGAM|nr:hypothetical protein FIBSPDRAFT_876911 [Fibularhizoctonia sp. CBS 109695]
MHPVPARLYKYLPPISLDPGCTIPRARWLWAMAEVTRELRPWYYYKKFVAARKRYTELYRRYYLSDILEDIDMEELRHYECTFPSSDIRFWRSIVRTHYSECIHL